MTGVTELELRSGANAGPARLRAGMVMAPTSLAEHLFGSTPTALLEHAAVVGCFGQLTMQAREQLAQADVLITGWGAPQLSPEDLDAMPALRAIIHAGGSVEAVADLHELRERGVVASNAGESNAVPVAEYSLAMILLATRQAWRAEALYRQRRAHIDREVEFLDAGSFRRTVGLVAASRIGRKVIGLLRDTDISVLLYDPYVTDAEAAALGARRVPLADLLSASDVVSVHAPLTAETIGLLGEAELDLMRPGTTLINTARGPIVDHGALRRRLMRGDLTAVLDVSDPEPLPPDDVLWDLPNVVLTPHIAGAMGSDLRRLGDHVTSEIARLRHGHPLQCVEQVPSVAPNQR